MTSHDKRKERAMVKIEEFCVGGERAHTLRLPFSVGEWTYATDGRVLLRVPRRAGVDERVGVPDVEKLPFDHASIGDWWPLPHVSDNTPACCYCGGSGKVVFCPECEGEGEIEWETRFNVYSDTCKSCHGDEVISASTTGVEPSFCDRCLGTGKKSIAVDVGRNETDGINTIYLAKLASLPEVRISLEGEQGSPFRVIFDGGCGLVMPMLLRAR